MEIIVQTNDTIFSRSILVTFDEDVIGVISHEVFKDIDRWDPVPALEQMIRHEVYQENNKLEFIFDRPEWNPLTDPGPFYFRVMAYIPGLSMPDMATGVMEATTILTQSKDNTWKLL